MKNKHKTLYHLLTKLDNIEGEIEYICHKISIHDNDFNNNNINLLHIKYKELEEQIDKVINN